MAYFDSIKIGGTIKQVQVVQELNTLPSPVLETSPQLVKIGNDLYMRESKMGGAYGTYRFMLVPTNQQVHSVNFISNGKTFGEIIINDSGEMAYNSTLVYSNGNWVNEAYKTIAIFDSSYSSGLVDFLNNNAEKIIDGYYKYIKVSSEGGSVVLEKDVSTTGGNLAFADDITMEEFDTLWNNEFIMLNILTGTTEFTSQTLLKKVRQGTAGATPVMSMVFTQVQPTNETTINYAELTISKDTSDDYISYEFKTYDITSGSPKIVDLNDFVPKTATQGTLTVGALNVLQQSNENYIIFNDEIYRLADKQHNAGYLVYSHNGHDTTGCFFQKCITITLSSRAWVLETQENQAKLTAGDNITIENNVISATGGSGGTSDTAYVSDSTLYIEEGTTSGSGGENILDIYIDSTKINQENETVGEILEALFGFFTTTPISDAYQDTIGTVLFMVKALNFTSIVNPPKLPDVDSVSLSDLGITQTITTEQLQKVDGVRFYSINPDTQEEISTIILKPTVPILNMTFGVNVIVPFKSLSGVSDLNCFNTEIFFAPNDQGIVQTLSISSVFFGITATN